MKVALALLLPLGLGAEGWTEAGRDSGVIVYVREQPKRETLGVGVIEAPPWIAKNAIDDVDARTGRMPYLLESRVLKRDARGVVVYNRTSAPVVADRDYTIRMFDASFVKPDGSVVYVVRFKTANDEGPPVRSGVVRVNETYGEWRFEPIAGGAMTRAYYFVYADPGGAVPQALANWGTEQMIAGVFNALRERVRDPAYRAKEPDKPLRVVDADHSFDNFAGK
jgi:hypothetical protein